MFPLRSLSLYSDSFLYNIRSRILYPYISNRSFILSTLNELELYIITNNTKTINYRASKLLELNKQFKITLICRKAIHNFYPANYTVFIKSGINFFSILKKLKFKKLSDYLNNKFYFPGPEDSLRKKRD